MKSEMVIFYAFNWCYNINWASAYKDWILFMRLYLFRISSIWYSKSSHFSMMEVTISVSRWCVTEVYLLVDRGDNRYLPLVLIWNVCRFMLKGVWRTDAKVVWNDVIGEQEAKRVSCSRCYRRCEVWFQMQSHLRDLLVEQETECVSCGCRLWRCLQEELVFPRCGFILVVETIESRELWVCCCGTRGWARLLSAPL